MKQSRASASQASMTSFLGAAGAFLASFPQWALFTSTSSFTTFFRRLITNIALFTSPFNIMSALFRRDSRIRPDPEPKRRMVHLKTKEECRLGNETIQVWTVELPSKHAEGILKYLHLPPLPHPTLSHLADTAV
jgi:tRNA-specific adenosine deaminase 3